jgi:tRNA1(Val) A37 N6-methylase TrmN6
MTDPACSAPSPAGVSEDALMGGRVRLRQPVRGYRAAIDPVFLAAAVPASAGESVLDAGAGTGAAALCLARRVPGCRVVGIEIQRDLARLGMDNAALNGLADRVEIMVGDLAAPPPGLAPGTVDHVMVNPPHLEAERALAPPDPSKALANVESSAGLAAWVRVSLASVRAKGSVTFIHRADRLDALLSALHGAAGGIVVYPLWPSAGRPAKRVLVRARKGVATQLRLASGLVLHDACDRFTAAAEAVLRDGQGLDL